MGPLTLPVRRSLLVPALLALGLAASGCGGGFGSKQPAETVTPLTSYVALGDGFTAAPYVGGTTEKTCLRSSDNYPAQVAKALGLTDFKDESCSGATIKSLTSSSKGADGTTKLSAQVDAVTSTTSLVTLSVGIENDNVLHSMFHVCTATPCGTDVLAKPLLSKLTAAGTAITDAVRSVQDKAPNAYIVVVGYPLVMPATGLCAALPRISDDQLTAANAIYQIINGNLRSAAQQVGAAYIDAATLSSGHTPCDNVPWVHGATVSGKDKPFYPLAAEQKAVADAITQQVKIR
ncbi:MAG TPA: SGNH/GDSL hydrolase family protein [Marmoricola sp.]|jgi:hypothetical protein|nr:SGNH/GDSL hydrolase family protein [Marmoricola sp.]